MNKMDFNLKPYLKEQRLIVDQCLDRVLTEFDPDRELVKAMAHSLMAGGKRLRPILAIAAAQACGKDPTVTLPACCTLELVHTYSLIHDDLPAMDDDDLRRGIPTCHKAFSEATAILAGDALLTHAFSVLAEPGPVFDKFPDSETRLALIARIADAAGPLGMVEGQMMDMQAFGSERENRLDRIKRIHSLKTGRMITVSVESGAISVGAPKKMIKDLSTYARKIGLAFQVADDILNVEGDPGKMGKAAGSDSINDKMTFPAIIGLEASKKYAGELVEEAKTAIQALGPDSAALNAIADYIVNRDR